MDARHVHLGMSIDGVNTFGKQYTNHSTWPIVLVNSKFPLDLTTKVEHILLSSILLGMIFNIYVLMIFCKLQITNLNIKVDIHDLKSLG